MRIAARLAVCALALTAVAADHDAGPPPADACTDLGGATAVTPHGIEETFRGAPVADPTSIAGEDIGQETGLADASIVERRYVLDLAPADGAERVDVIVDWTDPTEPDLRTDYDVYVYDGDGNALGESTGDNLLGGVKEERVGLANVDQCDVLVVHVKNWLGTPAVDMSLRVQPSQLTGHAVEQLCEPVEGVPVITLGGTGEVFRGSAVADPTSVVGPDVGQETGLHAASIVEFRYLLELPDHVASVGSTRITLDWTEPTQPDLRTDYDLHVYDGDGNALAESTGDNLLGGVQQEIATVAGLGDCTELVVHVQNWLGTPLADATLSVDLTQPVGAS